MCFATDDFETPACITVNIRKARKHYTCDECLAQIDPGELYRSYKGIDSHGDGFNYSFCGVCECERQAIHKIELAKGCRWKDTWCPVGELSDAVVDYNITPATVEDGQAFLVREKGGAK